ncbi:hypothetical protein ABTE36_20405, partial [Acinetobacter baumannii]
AGGLAPAGGAAFACVFSWRFACPERKKNVQNTPQIPLQDDVPKKQQKAVQKSVLKEIHKKAQINAGGLPWWRPADVIT